MKITIKCLFIFLSLLFILVMFNQEAKSQVFLSLKLGITPKHGTGPSFYPGPNISIEIDPNKELVAIEDKRKLRTLCKKEPMSIDTIRTSLLEVDVSQACFDIIKQKAENTERKYKDSCYEFTPEGELVFRTWQDIAEEKSTRRLIR